MSAFFKSVGLTLLVSIASFLPGTVLASGGEIAVIAKTTNSTFWQNVNKGASDSVKKYSGYTVNFLGAASESNIAAQQKLLESAVSRKVAGIVLAPSDPESMVAGMKKAWEAKIPLVVIDSQASKNAEKYYQSFLSTDNAKAGQLCAKKMIELAGKTGKVAIMSYVAGSGSEIGRVGEFKKYIEANSQLKIVGPFYSKSQMITALSQTTDVLSANPDLVGIFGANEPTAIGVGRAISQAGKSGKIVALGFDGNEDLQKFVKDGTFSAIAVQGSYAMGSMGVDTIINIINGQKAPKFVDTGVVIVTKENIELPEAKNVLY